MDPEPPKVMLGKLRVLGIVIALAGRFWRFGEICLEMNTAESLKESVGCAFFFPLLTAVICLRAGRE